MALAGPIAQRRHKPRSRWRYGGSGATRGEFIAKGSDHQHALDLIARLYEGQQKIIDTYWRYLEARAEVIVDAHWTEISRLAGALLEHQTLKGEEILAVVLPPDLLDLRKDLKRQSHEDALRKGH